MDWRWQEMDGDGHSRLLVASSENDGATVDPLSLREKVCLPLSPLSLTSYNLLSFHSVSLCLGPRGLWRMAQVSVLEGILPCFLSRGRSDRALHCAAAGVVRAVH